MKTQEILAVQVLVPAAAAAAVSVSASVAVVVVVVVAVAVAVAVSEYTGTPTSREVFLLLSCPSNKPRHSRTEFVTITNQRGPSFRN